MPSVCFDIFAQSRDFKRHTIDEDCDRAMRDAGRDAAQSGGFRACDHRLGQEARCTIDFMYERAQQSIAQSPTDDACLAAVLAQEIEKADEGLVLKKSRGARRRR
jgi:hypothetical protein